MNAGEFSSTHASPKNLCDAYLLQEQLAERRTRGGDSAVGFKIACTNAAAQAFIGVDHPCYAQLFQSNQLTTPVVHVRRDRRYGIECELGVVLARDVAVGNDPVDNIGSIAIAIEVVEDRYDGIANAGAPALVADGFAHYGFVVGELRPYHGEELGAFVAHMALGGQVIDHAPSSTVLGSPANALRWLQSAIEARGSTLRGGNVVLTGSITPTFWLSAFPARITCSLSAGLGSLQLAIVQDDQEQTSLVSATV